MFRRKAALGAAAALTALWLTGCSGGDGSKNDNVAGSVSVTVNEDEQSVTIDNDNGKSTLSGVNERPKLFPEEIPLPEDAVISASLENPDKGSSMVAIEVEQAFEDVVMLYEEYVASAGYAEALPTTKEADSYWFSGNRDQESLVILISKDLERDGWTTGSVTYQKAP